MKKNKGAFLAFVLAAMMTVTTAWAMPLDVYGASASSKRQEASEKSAAADEAGEKASDLFQKVAEAEKQITELKQSIASKQSKIASLQTELETKQEEINQQSEDLDARLRAMYKTGSTGIIEVILSSNNIEELITNVSMVQRILENDQDVLKQLEDDYKEIDKIKKEQQKQAESLEADKKEIEAIQEEYQADAEAYKAQEEQLQSEANALAAEAARLQAEADKKLEEQQQQQGGSSGGGGSSSSGGGGSSSSSGYRWPVNGGVITSWFGYRIHPVYGCWKYHDGVDVSGLGTGTPIYAIGDGIVTRASWYGGYGNCVMISIGNGYTTLYGHMSGYAVSYGQYVRKGQVVGYIGNTGISTGPHLHFSLLRNGVYVDPLSIVSP